MVVSSLIKRFVDQEDPLIVWGDGSAIRDFVYSKDVAKSMIKVIEKNIQIPINIGSGNGTSIKKLVYTILNSKKIKNKSKIVFDKSKPSGDKKRILDVKLAKSKGISCDTKLSIGISETIDWYLKNKNIFNKRYNHFKKNQLQLKSKFYNNWNKIIKANNNKIINFKIIGKVDK